MIKKDFIVPLYNWTVTFIEIENKYDAQEVSAYFDLFKCIDKDSYMNAIEQSLLDVGLTKVDHIGLKALVVIFPSSSEDMRRNTISHEKRHLEDFILTDAGIDDKEAAGYLSGYIAENLY